MLENLNEQQKKAVTITEGPLLVIAGAGSGKTKVLTTRIAYLIEQKKASPNQILAITFTNKAAFEMKKRIFQLLGQKIDLMQISTFHSFGLKIIKENYQKLDYQKNIIVLDANDSLTLIKRILKELNVDSKIYNPKGIKNRISSCKNELVDVEQFAKFRQNDFDEITYQVFKIYERKLKESNLVDFDDLLIKPILLFRKNKEVLKQYQLQYRYILIDEYQDTNEAQYVLVKMLAAYHQNLCVVGDESQAIYGFRGSNYKNILNFEKDFKGTEQVILEKNYRSTKNILKLANNVIKNNLQRKEKNLWTDNEEGDQVVLMQVEDEKEEAYYLVEQIETLVKHGESLEEMAVLYRTNAQSRAVEEAILRKGIPYRIVGGVQFYGRKEIKDLMAYLKLIYNQNDDLSLLRVINEPKRGIGEKTIGLIEENAKEKRVSLLAAIEDGKALVFKGIIETLIEKAKNCSLTELIEEILVISGIRQDLIDEKSALAEIRIENLEEFKSITKEFEEKYGIISLEDFLDEISILTDVVEYEKTVEQVTLMTIHAAKGLEFKYVFLVGVEEGLMPHCNSFSCSNDLEEERRLCYVALTRAKKNLWILYTRMRTIFGRMQLSIPSRFIEEMDLVETQKIKKTEKPIDMIDQTIEYFAGEKVFSDKYGKGIIVDVGDKILTIAFKKDIVKFIKGHKSIKKV